jgi:hypothetical protein
MRGDKYARRQICEETNMTEEIVKLVTMTMYEQLKLPMGFIAAMEEQLKLLAENNVLMESFNHLLDKRLSQFYYQIYHKWS